MARKTFKPDETDPKFKEFLANIKGMAEVGDWLVLAGYKGKRLYDMRDDIIATCEVIKVKDNYLIDGVSVTEYLKKLKLKLKAVKGD